VELREGYKLLIAPFSFGVTIVGQTNLKKKNEHKVLSASAGVYLSLISLRMRYKKSFTVLQQQIN
jgi:hypothetical protein